MTTFLWKFAEIRIDDDVYNFTIDTDVPIRIDHAPIGGFTSTRTNQTGITGSLTAQSQVTAARSSATSITSANSIGASITSTRTSNSSVIS